MIGEIVVSDDSRALYTQEVSNLDRWLQEEVRLLALKIATGQVSAAGACQERDILWEEHKNRLAEIKKRFPSG